jgi:hypothetical protein
LKEISIKKKDKVISHPIWTGLLVIAWIMVFIVVILTHAAVGKIVPPIVDLPTNVLKGFNETLGFQDIVKDGNIIKTQARDAMLLCRAGNNPLTCGSVSSYTSSTAVTSSQYAAISAAFANSISLIQKVTTDRCIDGDFGSTPTFSTQIRDELLALDPGELNCDVVFDSYCILYTAGKGLVDGAGIAIQAIEDMANAKAIKDVTKHADKLKAMHALPWILVVTMVFFTMFWAHNGGVCCCCEGGSMLGCCCLLMPSVLFWFVFFVFACIILAVGIAFSIYVADETPSGISRCTVSDTIDHLELQYSAFYDMVLKDLVDGCNIFYSSSQVAVALCLIIGLYACCICVFRPYRKKKGEE